MGALAKFQKMQRSDLRTKISLALIAVLVPVFSLLAISSHFYLRPTLLQEIEQIGISAGKTLATEVISQKLFEREDREAAIESRVREFLYLQSNIRRIEVFAKDPSSERLLLVASSVEEDPADVLLQIPEVSRITTELRDEVDGPERGWDIRVPIYGNLAGAKIQEPHPIGAVRVVVSINLASRLVGVLSQAFFIGGLIVAAMLFFLLNAVLRKTIENDRKLREAEKANLALSTQLHETERNLLNLEKFAVLGQLTGSFAHEIGTPLNAIGGHLALLKEEIGTPTSGTDRVGIIEGQLSKIAGIVRGFLQSTAKPISQKQLVDPHQAIEKTLGIVRPRFDGLGVKVDRDFDRNLGPIRVVPVDLEQVLLNLVNNSLDSIRLRGETDRILKFSTHLKKSGHDDLLELRMRDNGEGIRAEDLPRVFDPFFTTKAPGEGTGLGLSICREIVGRYGGRLTLDSKHGEWTEVCLEFPYRREEDAK